MFVLNYEASYEKCSENILKLWGLCFWLAPQKPSKKIPAKLSVLTCVQTAKRVSLTSLCTVCRDNKSITNQKGQLGDAKSSRKSLSSGAERPKRKFSRTCILRTSRGHSGGRPRSKTSGRPSKPWKTSIFGVRTSLTRTRGRPWPWGGSKTSARRASDWFFKASLAISPAEGQHRSGGHLCAKRWEAPGSSSASIISRCIAVTAANSWRSFLAVEYPLTKVHHLQKGEAFLLTVGAFLLTGKLLCLQSLKALIRCAFPL